MDLCVEHAHKQLKVWFFHCPHTFHTHLFEALLLPLSVAGAGVGAIVIALSAFVISEVKFQF